jgi:hypothetical protein
MTTGELLDAAVALLRTRALALLGWGFVVALVEQLILFALRGWADVAFVVFPSDDEDGFGRFWTLITVGFATEALCIGLLGIVASAAAPRALLGTAAPAARSRAVQGVIAAILVALVCGICAAAVLPWPLAYGLLGLAVPAVVIDRRGPFGALLRSLRLAGRGGLRIAWIRLLGYLTWLLIRIAIGLGGLALLTEFAAMNSAFIDHLFTGIAWLAVNCIAYPVLACLDATLHLDARMRTEGLDITLGRALKRGVSTEAALAVPR